MLSAVFRFNLPELGEHHALRDLLRFFAVERPRVPLVPPSWGLDIALKHLMSSAYEPLGSLSLRTLTKKTLFLVALATAKRVGELQALSRQVSFRGEDMYVSYLLYCALFAPSVRIWKGHCRRFLAPRLCSFPLVHRLVKFLKTLYHFFCERLFRVLALSMR